MIRSKSFWEGAGNLCLEEREWGRVKVPEVWVCDEDALPILVLQPDGRYASSSTSASFPFLAATGIDEWVQKPHTEPDTTCVKPLRTWVKRTLKHFVPKQDQDGGQEQYPTK